MKARSAARTSLTVPTTLRAAAVLILAIVGAGPLGSALRGQADAAGQDPLTNAITELRSSGSYRFHTELRQTTTPAATVYNAGRGSTTQQVLLEGVTDLDADALEMSIAVGGSGTAATTGLRLVDGVTYQRQGAGDWVSATTAATLDDVGSGDYLGTLSAARDVVDAGPQSYAGQIVDRYTYQLDGPEIVAQLSKSLSASGQAFAFADGATGTGELWVAADGRPIKQMLSLHLPTAGGPSVTLDVAVDFSEFGTATVPGVARAQGVDWRAAMDADATMAFALVLAALLLGWGLQRWMLRATPLRARLAMLVLIALVAGQAIPADRAAAAEPSRAAGPQGRTTPQVPVVPSPAAATTNQAEVAAAVSQATSSSASAADPHLDRLASPSLLGDPSDTVTDTDTDGLTDFVEERIGTDITLLDTDDDGVGDFDEVSGFDIGGATCAANGVAATMWYTDPVQPDTNGDGVGDGREWAVDTDGDCTPDVFDTDNDSDGVPDRLDASPSTGLSPAPYTATSALNLQIGGLTTTESLRTFVDFQIRPVDPRELQLSLRPMDWPSDARGQILDVNGSTNDLTLIPMLEIIVPAGHVLPSAVQLQDYNIQVGAAAADGSRPVYVPLTLLKDPQTGADVAFTGRMAYQSTASWFDAQSVRLTWLVQVRNDVPCDPSAADAAAIGCVAAGEVGGVPSGFIYDTPQVMQTYYTDWRLAGLSVTEEHGTNVAVVYEDPAVDQNPVDNSPSWWLNRVLLERFLSIAPGATTHEITMSNVTALLDRRAAGGATTLYDLPNTFNVDGAATTYASLDQALRATDATLLPNALAGAFANAGNGVQPWITTMYSSSSRTLSLDSGIGYASTTTGANGSAVVLLNFAYGDGTPEQVMSGVKATPFCATGATPRWAACSLEQVWSEIDRVTGSNTYDPDNPDADFTGADPVLLAGQRRLAHLTASMMMVGQHLPTSITTAEGRVVALNQSYERSQDLASGLGTVARVVVTRVAGYFYLRTIAAAAAQAPANVLRALGTPAGVTAAQGKALLFDPLSARTKGIAKAMIVVGLVAYFGAVAVLAGQGRYDDDEMASAQAGLLIRVFASTVAILVPVLYGVQFAELLKQAAVTGTSVRAVLGGSTQRLLGLSTKWSVVGALVSIVVSVGFFWYQMQSSGTPAFSTEFNTALAGVIASALYIGLTVALGVTVVGLLIVAVVAAIDAIASLVCEGQNISDDDCFSISRSITSAIAYVLYGTAPMVDVNAADLVSVDAPSTELRDPTLGYVTGNGVTVTLPVDTTITHTPASAWQMSSYLWFYTRSNIESGNFHHELTAPNAVTPAAASSPGDWDSVTAVGIQGYKATKHEEIGLLAGQVITFDQPGINRSFRMSLNSSYTLPTYECWTALFIPVCYKRSIEGTTSTNVNALVFDVLPASLAGFIATTSSGALAWDAHFVAPPDADGDGLLALSSGGLDPSDVTSDSDADGMSDGRELQLQADGVAVSPLSGDVDGDGLTDLQEIQLGSSPSLADTDNDGLPDGVEARRVAFDTNGKPYPAGGWTIDVDGRTVVVYADPTRTDSDGDGISDGAERALSLAADPADRVDDQLRPYHPTVVNTPPIGIVMTADNPGAFVKAGDTIDVVTAVTATTPIAPSVLDITVEPSDEPDPAPALLPFDPTTFVDSQTAEVTTSITVPAGSTGVDVAADVRAWLPDGAAQSPELTVVAGGPIASAAPLSAPALGAGSGQFVLSALSGDANINVVATNPVTGSAGVLDADGTRLLGSPAIDAACNDIGGCLTVWSDRSNCGSIVIKDITATNQQVALYINRNPSPVVPGYTSISQLELLWSSQGGQSFPVITTYCGNVNLVMRDLTIPAIDVGHYFGCVQPFPLCDNGSLGRSGYPLTQFTHCSNTCVIPGPTEFLRSGKSAYVTLDVNGSDNAPAVQARLTDTAGTPLAPAVTFERVSSSNVAVASDGVGFGVAWGEQFQRFSAAGVAVGPPTAIPGAATNRLTVVDGHYLLTSLVFGQNGAYQIVARDLTTNVARSLVSATVAGEFLPSFDIAFSATTGAAVLVHRMNDSSIEARSWEPFDVSANDAPTIATVFPAASVGGDPAASVEWDRVTGDFVVTAASYGSSRVRLATYTAQLLPTRQPVDLAPAGGITIGFTDLVCPSSSANPLVDLRFEELPGATTFADSSGAGNDASSDPTSSPDPGAPGAPGASLSRLALRFGTDDAVTMPNPAGNAVSVAFWYRGTAGASGQPFELASAGGTAGYGLQVAAATGVVSWRWGSTTVSSPGGINDGDWHFVAAARSLTGGLTLQVDAAPVVVASGATDAVTATATVTARGGAAVVTVDQLQLFNTALTRAAMLDVRDRASQGCMASATNERASTYWWKLNFHQPDTRGAALSASASLSLRVDDLAPTSSTSVPDVAVSSSAYVLAGTADDGLSGSGVTAVEVSIDGGPWTAAIGSESWTLAINIGQGDHLIRTRATDVAGNVETPGPAVTLRVDQTAPLLTLDSLAPTLRPIVDGASGQLQLALSGSATDSGSGVGAVEVALGPVGGPAGDGVWQPASFANGRWSVDYDIAPAAGVVSGPFRVSVRATDVAGNRTAVDGTTATVVVDNSAPTVTLSAVDQQRTYIAGSTTIGGLATDRAGSGVDAVEVSLTPIEDVTNPAADPASRRWLPAIVTGLGPSMSWQFLVPAGIEGHFQIDVRARDLAGNEQVIDRMWSGIIDTQAPRLRLTIAPTGKVRPRAGRFEMAYDCATEDLFLAVDRFSCPGGTLQPFVREFLEPSPLRDALAVVFPDQPVLTGLSSSYVLWDTTRSPNVTIGACDLFGNCSSSVGPVQQIVDQVASTRRADAPPGVLSTRTDAAASLPVAVVVSPTPAQHLAAESGVGVGIAVEAPGFIKTIQVLLDGVPVEVRAFTAASSTELYEAIVPVTVGSAGTHRVSVTVEDWAGATASSGDTEFFADMERPVVTIDNSPVSIERTWALGTDFLRFSGTVADDGTIALVQLKVNDGLWTDATFGAGVWTTAVHVPEADGSSLSLGVRAFDLAGHTFAISSSTSVDLTPPGVPYVRPDTHIDDGPGNASNGTEPFAISGVAGDNELAGFICEIDDLAVRPCGADVLLQDLATGEHVLTVAAIDAAGYVDLSPATWRWSVLPTGPQPSISGAPTNPTDERRALFTLGGPSSATLECSLDGSVFASCGDTIAYDDLAPGSHTFQTRALVGGAPGSPVAYRWTILNEAPAPANQAAVVRKNDAIGRSITLVADDVDPVTFHIVDQPQHGFLEGTAPNLRYVPFTDYVGPDEFSFVGDDGQLTSGAGRVRILVSSGSIAPVIQVPAGISVTALPGRGYAEVTFTATATDADSLASVAAEGSPFGAVVPVVCTPASGTRFPIGTSEVICTATDVDGNSTVGRFLVRVSRQSGSVPVTGGGLSPVLPATLLLLCGLAFVLASRRFGKTAGLRA